MSSKSSKKFECNKCKKNFLKKNNLNDHVLAKHSNVEKYECSICKKSFSYKQSLNRHMNGHKVEISVYSCSECGYSSQLKFMLVRHIRSVHLNKNDSVMHVSCMFCHQRCTKSNLSTHYVLCHQTEIVSEKLNFNSLDAFYAWKHKVENQDVSRFVKARTTYVGVSGSKHLFFKCHRDGKYKPKGKNIRKLKSLGTNKIGSHCPARMDVLVEGNEVNVLYIKTHVGHDLEPKRLTLKKIDKEYLTEQLRIPDTNYDDILSVVKTLDSNSRLHHLTKTDLIKLKSSLKETSRNDNNQNIKVAENDDKLNYTIEINDVFNDDFVSLFNSQNEENMSPILSSENEILSKSDKKNLISVNTSPTSDPINLNNNFSCKIKPMYELDVEQQLVEQNKPIPILEFNSEMLENNPVIDYQQQLTYFEDEKSSIMEKMKSIVSEITCSNELAIVHDGLVNIMSTIHQRRNVINQAVVNGDLDSIIMFDDSILTK